MNYQFCQKWNLRAACCLPSSSKIWIEFFHRFYSLSFHALLHLFAIETRFEWNIKIFLWNHDKYSPEVIWWFPKTLTLGVYGILLNFMIIGEPKTFYWPTPTLGQFFYKQFYPPAILSPAGRLVENQLFQKKSNDLSCWSKFDDDHFFP